ncbi:ATP-binding cassette domain-containing protein, partial [Candidatus Sumerlaeota bacterium]|nr:ATP-binding cassette domain-containing protein [Candidatus Sumerlaeota bacterium]
MVQLDDIHHAYGSARSENDSVLRGLDLTVQAGEFVAVCGLSGSGKSTLLSIIGGILLPSRGRAQVGGCDLLHLGDGELSALRNRMIGFVFQDYHLAPVLTALENAMV